MRRDLVGEIEAARERSRISDHYAVTFSLGVLAGRLRSLSDPSEETLGYLTIAAVANLEVFFRHALRDLLDRGGAFLDRADPVIKSAQVKLDSTVAAALHGEKVTFGELVSTSLRASSVPGASIHLSTILGTDFLDSVRTEHASKSDTDFDGLMKDLADLYETRHIIAHEARPQISLSSEGVGRWLEAAFAFAYAGADVITKQLYPDFPQTQADLTRLAQTAAAEAVAYAESNVHTLSEQTPALRTELLRVHAEWKTWAESAARLQARITSEGGSAEPMIHANALHELAESYAEFIGEILEQVESLANKELL